MNNLSISERYFLLSMKKKGTLGSDQHTQLGLIMAGLLDLQVAEILTIQKNEIQLIKNDLPDDLDFLNSLFHKIVNLKKKTLEKLADQYTGTFLDKELNLLITSVRDYLVSKKMITQRTEEGLLGSKECYFADESAIEAILDEIKKEIGSAELNQAVIASTILLQQTKILQRYLSKEELTTIKKGLKQLENNDVAKNLQRMIQELDSSYMAMFVVTSFL